MVIKMGKIDIIVNTNVMTDVVMKGECDEYYGYFYQCESEMVN